MAFGVRVPVEDLNVSDPGFTANEVKKERERLAQIAPDWADREAKRLKEAERASIFVGAVVLFCLLLWALSCDGRPETEQTMRSIDPASVGSR